MCKVQVTDSNEPLVANSSSVSSTCEVQVLDSNEPLVANSSSVSSTCEVQVLDSNKPLVTSAYSSGTAAPFDEDSTGRKEYNCEEMRSLWSWKKLYEKLGATEQCIEFAINRGLIRAQKLCYRHKKLMILSTCDGQGPLGSFRCRKSSCRMKSYGRATGTFFENMKIPITIVFQIMFGFCDRQTYFQIKREVASSDGQVLSSSTVTNWYNHCRETIVAYESENQEEGQWEGLKKELQQNRCKYNSTDVFIECSWRRKIHLRHGDPFEELIKAIKYVYPIKYTAARLGGVL